MSRTTSTSYITPIKSDGTVETEDDATFGRGGFTLASGTTYFYPIGGQSAEVSAVHVQWDAAIILTSVTVEDSNFPESDVAHHSVAAGDWIDEDPTTAFVGTVGAGVTVTNGVVAVAGGQQGGAMFHVADTGSRRTRLKVVVAGTGGNVRVAAWGKE